MTLQQQLIALAAVMLLALAVMRVVRVRLGRAPHPAGKARPLFVLAFVLVPPVALEVATNPNAEAGQLHGIESVLVYVGALITGTLLMGVAALIVHFIAPVRTRRPLMLALLGSEGGPNDLPFDPTMTDKLAERVALVERRNAVFPRGRDFPAQVDRSGFREDWDALDSATRSLEEQIDVDVHLGLGIAYHASATARDARERLESLRRLAADQGQVWAPA